jgi:hypothetical protein
MVKLKLLLMSAVIVFCTSPAWAQFIPDPDVQGKIKDARQEISLTGKIAYSKELGGYFLQAGMAGNKVILNQNYEALKKFSKGRKDVNVQGRMNPLDIKARHIYIEKIDGKPYHGDKAPLVKPNQKLTPFF